MGMVLAIAVVMMIDTSEDSGIAMERRRKIIAGGESGTRGGRDSRVSRVSRVSTGELRAGVVQDKAVGTARWNCKCVSPRHGKEFRE
jgi:hypothetical protein